MRWAPTRLPRQTTLVCRDIEGVAGLDSCRYGYENMRAKRRRFKTHRACFKCGTGLTANAAFCANCGASQAVTTVPVAETSTRASMGGATSNGIALRPEETILFEGDVVLLKSKISVSQTDAVITNQRPFVTEGNVRYRYLSNRIASLVATPVFKL